MNSLQLQHITKSFEKGRKILDDISIDLPSGKFAGLVGPSGCGKTTLLRIVAGLESPDAGTLRCGERTFVESAQKVFLPPERRNIGMLFQSYALWPHMTALDNVAFPLKMRGIDKAKREEEARKLLKMVGLEGLELRLPSRLSGGQQQRVGLARALCGKPSLWLLDEPLSNLDAALRTSMRQEIRRLQKEFSVTALIVTHDWKDAEEICDEVVAIDQGHIAQRGSPAEIKKNPANDFVRRITQAT